jgi:transcription elongation factor Elf1
VTEFVDLKWAKIDGEWVIYQEELDEWVRQQPSPRAPPCPVCKSTRAGMRDIKLDEKNKIKRGICAACGAKLTIMNARMKSTAKKN